MLAYIRDNQVDYVIVNKVDRLARNLEDDIDIRRAIKEAGAILVSATENIDGESPQNMLLHGIMASIAEFYSRNLATEVMKGMGQKAKSGGTPFMAPMGYLNMQTVDEMGRESRYVAVDEERAPLVKLAFKYYATGDWVARKLAEYLSARGLTSRPTPRKPARAISEKMLYALLANPYYKGTVLFKGVAHTGKHEPLVDEVTWQKVQDVLASHRNGERTRIHNHFLKGTLFCGTCGKRLIVHNAKSGSGAYYPYFVCTSKHSKGEQRKERCQQHKERCQQHAVLIYKVEEPIEKLYEHISLTPESRQLLEVWLSEEVE
jgi:DNA invertase Pin-like site-specific DNA recombinase